MNTDEVVILDFETTGLSPKSSGRIIEVGAAIVKDDEVVGTFCELMNPDMYIPFFISSLTGITNEMIEGKPSPEEVMPHLKEFIGERPIVAHNASFDRSFLYAEMERVELYINNPVLCTLLLSRRLIPDAYNYKLGTLVDHLNIYIEPDHKAHRALDDVIVTAKLWGHLKDKVAEYTGIEQPELSLFKKISSKPKNEVLNFLTKYALMHRS